jgi:hypothetical protein
MSVSLAVNVTPWWLTSSFIPVKIGMVVLLEIALETWPIDSLSSFLRMLIFMISLLAEKLGNGCTFDLFETCS